MRASLARSTLAKLGRFEIQSPRASPATRPDRRLFEHFSRLLRAAQPLELQGEPTNAVYGFINMLKKLLREENPELVGIALDMAEKTFRSERFAEYKANRTPMPEDLKSQLPWIRRAIEAFRIPILEAQKYEADDVLGSLARRPRGGLRGRAGERRQGPDAARAPRHLALPHRAQQALRRGRA
jgi:hypothetical protein